MARNDQTLFTPYIDDKIKEVKNEYRWLIGIFVVICGAIFSGMFCFYNKVDNKVDKLSEQVIRIDQRIQDMVYKK